MSFPRVAPKEAEILHLLSSGREWYGLELVKESHGAIKRGTVYVLLDRMEEKGLVTSRKEEEKREDQVAPLRLYKITGLGSRVLKALDAAEAIFYGARHAGAR